MKTTIISISSLALAFIATAAEPAKTKPASAEFERMKSLVGTWTGKTDMGQGPIDMTIRFRMIAAGSVIEERVFEGTDHEMVTMYYDDKDGKLALTHYCVFGNRPAMNVKSSDEKSIIFDFDGSCCTIDPKTESHMHGMVVRFVDKDTIATSCNAVIDGKKSESNETTLKRTK